jgi:hypothetical protein
MKEGKVSHYDQFILNVTQNIFYTTEIHIKNNCGWKEIWSSVSWY